MHARSRFLRENTLVLSNTFVVFKPLILISGVIITKN